MSLLNKALIIIYVCEQHALICQPIPIDEPHRASGTLFSPMNLQQTVKRTKPLKKTPLSAKAQ